MSAYGGKSILREKSLTFAVVIVNLSEQLCKDRNNYRLADQILRSGTSIGANIRESSGAESVADFIHKLSIAKKECEETGYWLEVLIASNRITQAEFESLSSSVSELMAMLRSSILTAKKRVKR